MARSTVLEGGARPAIYRRTQGLRRSVRKIISLLVTGVELIAALAVSLGVWWVIWFAVSSLASAWSS
jgi:hypothetical protein